MEALVNISSKLPQVGDSIFTVMSKMAAENDAVNLAQGYPDFDPDKRLVKAVNKAMTQGHNQYAPMAGVMELREAIASKTELLYGSSYHPESEITVTPGATSAIYTAITASIKEDDEVIIFEPVYDCYVPAIKLNGGKPIYIELKYPDYRIDWEEVKKVINFKTKMIIFTNPHNPTGTILTEEDIAELTKIVDNTDIIILSDEVYEHIVFENKTHLSITKYQELAARSYVISSFGKTYHVTGWKMGYVVAPERLMKEFRKVYQYLAFAANTPVQLGLVEILEHKELYLDLAKQFEVKRNLFAQAVSGSRFQLLPSEGSYFQLLGFKGMSDLSDIQFAEHLTREHKIASIPISVFYKSHNDNQVLRFCFAKSEKAIEKAGEILCKI